MMDPDGSIGPNVDGIRSCSLGTATDNRLRR